MTSYFDKRKKQRLYQQWVEKSGLPQESVPDIEQKDDSTEAPADSSRSRRPSIQSDFIFSLTVRHLLYLLLTIIVLLITTVSLATILIMRSC